MKRALTVSVVVALLMSLILVGTSLASDGSCSYAKEKNLYIDLSLHPAVASKLFLLGTSGKSFSTQEYAHQAACDQGAGIKHFYIVLQVNGKALLYIDPPIAYE